jgi:hypothetical protein
MVKTELFQNKDVILYLDPAQATKINGSPCGSRSMMKNPDSKQQKLWVPCRSGTLMKAYGNFEKV